MIRVIRIIIGFTWKIYFGLCFFGSVLLVFPLYYILLLNRKFFPVVHQMNRLMMRWVLTLTGIFMSIDYRVKKKSYPHPAVYCANHNSYLDILTVYLSIPNYFAAMGKSDIKNIPLVSSFFKEMNVLVSRGNKRAAYRSLEKAGEELVRGNSMLLFPEGGIKSNNSKVHRFKNGAFTMAIKNQVPIVPITFLNNWKLFQIGVMIRTFARPGISRVVVHEPISTKGMTLDDVTALRVKVQGIIEKEMEKYLAK
jgi:1-acyl-sn-glycerol-3-phosphate acyltransferase